MVEEIGEQIEDLRLQIHGLSRTVELVPLRVERIIAEPVAHSQPPPPVDGIPLEDLWAV
jgi:hypothetical protein